MSRYSQAVTASYHASGLYEPYDSYDYLYIWVEKCEIAFDVLYQYQPNLIYFDRHMMNKIWTLLKFQRAF